MVQAHYDVEKGILLARAEAIQAAKQPSYTRGSGDVLHNFKTAAGAANITAEQAWVVFAKKQWDAICALMTQPDLEVAEPPIERFADLMNYMKLGYALWVERQDNGGY